MVRKDPLRQRGPAPNRGRIGAVKVDTSAKTLFDLRPEAEYERLWNHVLVGTNTCVDMITNYANMGMPGLNMQRLKDMRDRLDSIIKTTRLQNEQPKNLPSVPSG